MFKTYFSSVCAGHLWRNFSLAKAKVAYNNIYRLFLNLNGDSSMSRNYVEHNVHNFDSLLRTYMSGFIKRLSHGKNKIVNTICESVYFMYESRMFKRWIDEAYAL